MNDEWTPFVLRPQKAFEVLELEMPPTVVLAKMSERPKGTPRTQVNELRIMENANETLMMMDMQGSLRKVLVAYKGIQRLALDFGIDKGALEPGRKKTVFSAIQMDQLPDLRHLTLRYEPCFDPSTTRVEPFNLSSNLPNIARRITTHLCYLTAMCNRSDSPDEELEDRQDYPSQ
ncbi:hypothetical protein QFC22_001896 [Naganishia vaughanmartiniae]|uniref:Uncharacterized protein n=1 Tax=Naganishia vaughanmartiniae TaxID=1424756 RepID=A0ACC2XEK2_9TREE|nr:hypothetical protein QFC22_001896 [Naganishia vaughanmartiniae]